MRQSELEESFSKGDPDMPSLSLAQSYHGRIRSKILAPLTCATFPSTVLFSLWVLLLPFLDWLGVWGCVCREGMLLLKTVWEGGVLQGSILQKEHAGWE